MSDTTFGEARNIYSIYVLKVHWQRQFTRLVKVRLREGKDLRSEKIKFQHMKFAKSRGEKFSGGFIEYDRN